MELRRVEFRSLGYEACLDLRRRLLREPLGLEWSEADLAQEERESHFGLFENEVPVACLAVRPLGNGAAKLRQMAVEADRQGQGVGRRLVGEVLRVLVAEGIREVELHAREEAAGFYERLGFSRGGERFLEVGIPHYRMWRTTVG